MVRRDGDFARTSTGFGIIFSSVTPFVALIDFGAILHIPKRTQTFNFTPTNINYAHENAKGIETI